MKNPIAPKIIIMLFCIFLGACLNRRYQRKEKGEYKVLRQYQSNSVHPDSSLVVCTIIDKLSNKPIEYGYISVENDSTMVMSRNEQIGSVIRLAVKPGEYKVIIFHPGNTTLTTKKILLNPETETHLEVKLGYHAFISY